jgi:hypothetical protein
MPSGLHDLLTRKSDKVSCEATAIEHADRRIDAPLNDSAWGLGVLVEGVNPVVEYVSLLYPGI